MGQGNHLDDSRPPAIDDEIRESLEQEAAGASDIPRPRLWSLRNLIERMVECTEKCIRHSLTALPIVLVGLECFGLSVSVKPDGASSHVAI